MLTTLQERLSLQAVSPRPGGGDGHGVLLSYSGFVCRAGYGLSLEAGAVVMDVINKYIVVGNCSLLKSKYITQEMEPNMLPMYVCMYVCMYVRMRVCCMYTLCMYVFI